MDGRDVYFIHLFICFEKYNISANILEIVIQIGKKICYNTSIRDGQMRQAADDLRIVLLHS